MISSWWSIKLLTVILEGDHYLHSFWMGVYMSSKASFGVLNLTHDIDEVRIFLAFINYGGQKAVDPGRWRRSSVINVFADLNLYWHSEVEIPKKETLIYSFGRRWFEDVHGDSIHEEHNWILEYKWNHWRQNIGEQSLLKVETLEAL